MEKRITFRITFEKLSLAEAAEIEEKIEAALEDHGHNVMEIQAMPMIAAFVPREGTPED